MANGLFGGGDGSEENPYKVEDGADFNTIRNNKSACYLQTKNISLLEYDNWLPIYYTNEYMTNAFAGVYDGAHYSINDLKCTNGDYGSLFGPTGIGTIKRVKVIDAQIGGTGLTDIEYASILVNYVNGTVIQDCSVTGNVKGEEASGFAWTVSDGYTPEGYIDGKIERCSSNAKVIGKYYALGFFKGIESSKSEVNDCYAKGSVSNGGTSECYLSTFGYGNSDSYGVPTRCYSVVECFQGAISQGNTLYKQGLFALVNDDDSLLSDSCYADVSIGGMADSWNSNIGYDNGQAYARGTDGKLYNCIQYQSAIDYNLVPPGPRLYARPTSGARWSEFWESALTADSEVARTTSQMKTEANYIGWDFENVWKIDEGKSYPYFRTPGTSTKCTVFPLFRRITRKFS